jgi:hypothetical protein
MNSSSSAAGSRRQAQLRGNEIHERGITRICGARGAAPSIPAAGTDAAGVAGTCTACGSGSSGRRSSASTCGKWLPSCPGSGNTRPGIPAAEDLFKEGRTIAPALGSPSAGVRFGEAATQGPVEEAVLLLLAWLRVSRRHGEFGGQERRGGNQGIVRAGDRTTQRATRSPTVA